MPSENQWSTDDELTFLQNIGKSPKGRFSRPVLLKRYWEGAVKRDNWGDLDKWRILAYLVKEIRRCEGGK